MPRRSRTTAQVAGAREATAIAATLGAHIRSAQRAHGWTLATLARRTGLSIPWLSEIERGLGTHATLETLVAIGAALDRPIAVSLSQPLGSVAGVRDAGHLEIQEHVLRLAAATGRVGTFEVPTKPSDPTRSTDVGIRDPTNRARILVECWNTFGDLGAAVRSTTRKQAEVTAAWPDDRVATVWVIRASAANRALLERYLHVIDAAFPGSSRAWLHALVDGAPPPADPGIVWFDPGKGRLVERRATPSRAGRRATIAA